MTAVRVSSVHDLRHMWRQTPGNDGVWEELNFIFTGRGAVLDDDHGADWLVVLDEYPPGTTTCVPLERRILFVTEPPSIKRYPRDYLNLFGIVVSPYPQPGFRGQLVRMHGALPWFYGATIGGEAAADNDVSPMLWSDLLAIDPASFPARGLISAVCSTKMMNLNHARRLRFLAMLKAELGDALAIFGRGFKAIHDKREGIDGFRYHLVLENGLEQHGWTEKLADPILGGAFPIVAGAPQLENDFDPRGFALIDIRRPRAAIAEVKRILADDRVRDAREAMAENKRRLMREHNFFAVCARLIRHGGRKDVAGIAQPEELPPYPRKSLAQRIFVVPRKLRKPLRKLYLAVAERG